MNVETHAEKEEREMEAAIRMSLESAGAEASWSSGGRSGKHSSASGDDGASGSHTGGGAAAAACGGGSYEGGGSSYGDGGGAARIGGSSSSGCGGGGGGYDGAGAAVDARAGKRRRVERASEHVCPPVFMLTELPHATPEQASVLVDGRSMK